jgi:glutamyl-tRNA synthetase
MTVRTRFAPSPTGFLHVGGARTALFAWLVARKHGGQFILRIEDTDKEREVEGAIGHLMESLRWLGIEWDEGPNIDGPYAPYIQSQRLGLYKEYANKLVAAGFAYPDPYTSEQLESFRKKSEEEKRPFLYRDYRPESMRAEGARAEWDGHAPLRFKTPFLKRYTWNDLVRGELSAGEEALDDFILLKADGYPTYNFCHVVDDIEMQITHIMRGEEFISSMPKFLSLYDALDAKPPYFATLPSILGESGHKKLSKRDGAKDILDYRNEGYLPEALRNFLALLGWNPGTEQEILSREELIAQFDIARVQKSGAMFDETKLLFVNQQWMRNLTNEEYIDKGHLEALDLGRLHRSVPLLKERASTFGEAQELLTGELSCIFLRPDPKKEILLQKEPAGKAGFTKNILTQFALQIASLSQTADVEHIKLAIMSHADENPKENGGRGAVLWPLRYALSGQERSPDPFSLVYILGKDESVMRIKESLDILS